MGDDVLAAQDAWLVLDPGGDDRYTGTLNASVSLVVDLGGSDHHHPHAARGVGGAAVAIDTSGHDTWPAEDIGAGGAVYGAAVLLDRSGDDTYRGHYLTQAAAYEGAAIVIDEAGDDTWRAGGLAQGYGGSRGVGLLWDGGGDDVYVASGRFADGPDRLPQHSLSLSQGFAIGERPWVGGGAGLLVDVSGNDRYIADLFAQGCSYWFSRGYLIDRDGHDSYRAWQYAQGSGIHLSVGGLFDVAGDDDYTLAHLGQGSSHDFAVGWQVDGGGDDLYAARTTAQGGALASAATFFVDESGDDIYMVQRGDTSRGGGDYRRAQGVVALSIDMAGEDYRDGNGPAEGEIRRVWSYGLAWDRTPDQDIPPPPEPVAVPVRQPPTRFAAPDVSADLLLPTTIPALIAAEPASASQLREASHLTHPDDAAVARDVLAEEGQAALARMLPLLERDFLLEGYALQGIVRKQVAAGVEVESLLLEALEGHRYEAQRWLVSWLSELKAPSPAVLPAIRAVEGALLLRRSVAAALVRLEDTDGLESLLADPDAGVRAAAVRGLSDPKRLVEMLSDDSFLVRFNAAELLLSHPDTATVRTELQARWKHDFDRPAIRSLHLELLGRLGDTHTVKAAAEDPNDPWIRHRASTLLTQPHYDWRIP